MYLINQLEYKKKGKNLQHCSTRVLRTFSDKSYAKEYLNNCKLSNIINNGYNKYTLQEV